MKEEKKDNILYIRTDKETHLKIIKLADIEKRSISKEVEYIINKYYNEYIKNN